MQVTVDIPEHRVLEMMDHDEPVSEYIELAVALRQETDIPPETLAQIAAQTDEEFTTAAEHARL